jgi:type I restriction enzyme S subunit
MKQVKHTSLPRDWQLKSLGDLIDIRNGYAFKSRHFIASGVLLIRQSNLTTNGIGTDKPIFLPQTYLQEYAGHRINKGDVLIGMSGSIGKLCVYDLDVPALQNQRTGLVKFLAPQFREYIISYLRYIENELLTLAKGEAVKNISVAQIKSCLIPLPPADEAKRIILKMQPLLAKLETSIQKLTTAKANLDHYHNAVLQKALCDGQNSLRVKLGKVATIRNGYGFPVQLTKMDAGSVPFFKVADLAQTDGYGNLFLSNTKHYISAADYKSRRLDPLKTGSIVFAKTGGAIKLNRRAILKQPSLIDNNMMGIISSSGKLDNMYLYYLLLSMRLEKIGRATTVPSVRKGDVANISIPLPPVSKQLRIVLEIEGCLTSAGSLEKAISANIRQAGQLRQSIFKKAFAGKLIDN